MRRSHVTLLKVIGCDIVSGLVLLRHGGQREPVSSPFTPLAHEECVSVGSGLFTLVCLFSHV